MAERLPGTVWRLSVAWRALLAIVGGYTFAALLAAAMAGGLPRIGVSRSEAVIGGVLAALLILPLAPIMVFAARSTGRVTAQIFTAIAVLSIIVWMIGAPT